MRESADVRAAMLEFYDRLSAGDVDRFDDLVSSDPSAIIVGTAPGEWVAERDRMRYGFETEGVEIRPGRRAVGYAERDEDRALGWFLDDPVFVFPETGPLDTRLTAVLRHEGGRWKLLHFHVSIGVPDGEVAELARRWAGR